MSCWTEEKLYKLVKLYSKFINLWDREHPCHDNLRVRHTSYSKILEALCMPTCVSISDVITKLKELRSAYVSELKKIEVASKIGAVYKPESSWFGSMNEFLYDYLDADERLTEFSSSEDGTVSSEEILRKDCCSDSNSSPESDSDSSTDPCGKNSTRKICESFRAPKKSQAYFIRSPTVLRSTKMNTKYEFPMKNKMNAPSIPAVKNVSSPDRKNNVVKRFEDTRQCTKLDVKITSSDVSIKYCITENVNGDEKCYKKNLKGPRCPTDKPNYFRNIKMTISKSGYTAEVLGSKSNEIEDKDTGFWEMMSMLDVGVPYPLTKLETSYSPNPSCSCIVTSTTCLTARRCCEEVKNEREVEKIIEETEATNKNSKTLSCCSDVKIFREHEKAKNTKEDIFLEPCIKETKVVCLGDGTLFDDNLLELLQDLSIKICPVEGTCATGNCSEEHDRVGDIRNPLSCKTCSSVTRPVKEYEINAAGSAVKNDAGGSSSLNNEAPSNTEENIRQDNVEAEANESTETEEDSESFTKSENTEDEKKFQSSDSPRNNDVTVMNFDESRSRNERDAIIVEAKRELWEAGRLYNSGKYITHDILSSGLKNEDDSYEFDDFGAQVASSLKTMGKQRANKLRKIISNTIQNENGKKF